MTVGGVRVGAGQRRTITIPMGVMSNHAPMGLPLHVIHGRRDGPTLFVSAAVHGDEVNGVEIIRRLLNSAIVSRLKGTLLAVPIVNVHGFISHSRYLPDRRDLNRSFPGNPKGSLASQLADVFMEEVVKRSTHGIDLHTASFHRDNLPQVRCQLDDPEQAAMAEAFGAPVILDSKVREGSLRGAAAEAGVQSLLYEAGEALRFDETAIRTGYLGVVRVMHAIGMLGGRAPKKRMESAVCDSSTWVRSPASGILRATAAKGAAVRTGDTLGIVSDPFGETEEEVNAHADGIIIGRTNLPVVNQGDALFHIAQVGSHKEAAKIADLIQEEVEETFEMDHPPIV